MLLSTVRVGYSPPVFNVEVAGSRGIRPLSFYLLARTRLASQPARVSMPDFFTPFPPSPSIRVRVPSGAPDTQRSVQAFVRARAAIVTSRGGGPEKPGITELLDSLRLLFCVFIAALQRNQEESGGWAVVGVFSVFIPDRSQK